MDMSKSKLYSFQNGLICLLTPSGCQDRAVNGTRGVRKCIGNLIVQIKWPIFTKIYLLLGKSPKWPGVWFLVRFYTYLSFECGNFPGFGFWPFLVPIKCNCLPLLAILAIYLGNHLKLGDK